MTPSTSDTDRSDAVDVSDVLPDVRVSARARADLGFDEALAILGGLCRTALGRESTVDDPFVQSASELRLRLATAMEAKAAVLRVVQPDFAGIREVRHILEASGKGIVLAAADIIDVAKTIDALGRLKDVIEAQDEHAPALISMVEKLADERRFSRRVLRSFDESPALTDDASPELSIRRARVRQLHAEAQERLQALVREHDELGVLRDRNFTIRNDRYVLPVKSEYQGKVDGIVHDASQTHQTVFIEPRVLMALGNRIKIAKAEVVEEEQRILREMSEEIAELETRMASDLKVAGALEAAFARGAFAAAVDGIAVDVVVGHATVSLRRARHPLLAWAYGSASTKSGPKQGPPVTPNDLRLDGARCLVISGPNAGGKTVALKTVGLVSLLARAGVPVPVDEGSVIPAFAGVSVSIGDEQNLQGGFSSFSGHLAAIKGIVDDVDRDVARGPVLVLLDELMSGTDPAQGAALAQAVLEDLVAHGDGDLVSDRGSVSVVVTTHYDRLKALALAEAEANTETPKTSKHGQRAQRFRNASVGTDSFGKPTFVLHLDEVGTSNAFDAARRFGVKEATIDRALALLAPEQKELHALLRALAEQKGTLLARVAEAEAERARLREESVVLERKVVELDAERQRLRREGKRAFLDELREARQVVKEAIAQSQTGDARQKNEASQRLKKLEADTEASVQEATSLSSTALAPTSLKVGDTVELANMPGVKLTVEAVDGDDVSLARGAMRTRAQKDQLRLPQPEKPSKTERSLERKRSSGRRSGEGAAASLVDPRTSDNSLDVRGQRADDALEQLEAFLDKLLREGRQTGYVLHGHGGGALKKILRQALTQSRYVRGHNPGGIDDGGDAWTVVDVNADARV
jgi:DNA mismatch repair protein MutS2